MPLPITTYKDYKEGVYELPFSTITVKNLESFRDTYEVKYLDDLLGCELSALFVADLDNNGVPQDPRFIKIYDKICEKVGCVFIKTEGIKVMIQGVIYWEYGRTTTNKIGMQGANVAAGENAVVAKQSATQLIPNYNNSVKTYKGIQEYICLNKDIYPEFQGVGLNYTSWF